MVKTIESLFWGFDIKTRNKSRPLDIFHNPGWLLYNEIIFKKIAGNSGKSLNFWEIIFEMILLTKIDANFLWYILSVQIAFAQRHAMKFDVE